jgi:hypothetical protein
MPNNPIKLVVDCSTGVTTEVELTDEEVAQGKADAITFAAIEAECEAAAETRAALKTSARAKLVAGEPLTEEEASVLVI